MSKIVRSLVLMAAMAGLVSAGTVAVAPAQDKKTDKTDPKAKADPKADPKVEMPLAAGKLNDPILAHWQTGLGKSAVTLDLRQPADQHVDMQADRIEPPIQRVRHAQDQVKVGIARGRHRRTIQLVGRPLVFAAPAEDTRHSTPLRSLTRPVRP